MSAREFVLIQKMLWGINFIIALVLWHKGNAWFWKDVPFIEKILPVAIYGAGGAAAILISHRMFFGQVGREYFIKNNAAGILLTVLVAFAGFGIPLLAKL